VHDVEGRDRLAAGVLRVGDGVADHVLKEHLEDAAGLLVDEAGDALDTATASQTADSGLRDALLVLGGREEGKEGGGEARVSRGPGKEGEGGAG
jgi:hypothetical protein